MKAKDLRTGDLIGKHHARVIRIRRYWTDGEERIQVYTNKGGFYFAAEEEVKEVVVYDRPGCDYCGAVLGERCMCLEFGHMRSKK